MKKNNLLLVAGSGRKTGKTTIICRTIEQLRGLEITSVKISPHFYPPSEGLVLFDKAEGYEIFEETSRDSSKDSSRMLRSGAQKVYYIQTNEENIGKAFAKVYAVIEPGKPIICESPSLINHLQPGLFLIMISPEGAGSKNISHLKSFPHISFSYEEIMRTSSLPFSFEDGVWKYPIRV